MPNIGSVVQQQLIRANITTPEQLSQIGSREAWLRIRAFDPSACINMLYALEGAIQNTRWHHLPPAIKADLKAFFQSVQ